MIGLGSDKNVMPRRMLTKCFLRAGQINRQTLMVSLKRTIWGSTFIIVQRPVAHFDSKQV